MLTRLLGRLYDWLSPAEPVLCGDLIFVLAGRQSRKLYALELFRQRMAKSLVLSVGRFEIRKFARLPWPHKLDLLRLAASTPPAQRHYFVSLEAGGSQVELIPRGRLGTLSEIRALARWLQARPDIVSVLVVSSAPHLRRVRVCCRAFLPARLQLRFIATPEEEYLTRSDWWRNLSSRALVLKELGKLLLYGLLLLVPHRGLSKE